VGYIIDLAETVIPGGILRVDRCRMAFEHELTVGHYGLPHIEGREAVVEKFEDNTGKIITAAAGGRRIALIAYKGWDTVDSIIHKGRNAEAEESTVLYARRKRTAKNPSMELMIMALLHKTDDSDWTEEELRPIRKIRILDITPAFSALGAILSLTDGREIAVDFKNIDGMRGH
jgi:hypothetical protein